MKEIIKNDPRKNIFGCSDPEHILNKRNKFGHTPLYVAAKNGNYDAVELLLGYNADPYLVSFIDQDEKNTELPIHAAIKWSYPKITQILLDKVNYDFKTLKKCYKLAPNDHIKEIIQKYMKKTYPKKINCCTFSSCFGK
mmetsp:Transcript_16001/g.13545  ORF Transcript_16001/g.13545 Transcript_16001/m.13545 type:complete len:139 (+) Transcript_16001:1071-1487(+)